MLTNLCRGLVNHSTHKHLGLAEHILLAPFLLEYNLLKIWAKSGDLWYIHWKKKEEKKSKQAKIEEEKNLSEGSEWHCSKSIMFYFKQYKD